MVICLLIIFLGFILLFLYCSLVLAGAYDSVMERDIEEIKDK